MLMKAFKPFLSSLAYFLMRFFLYSVLFAPPGGATSSNQVWYARKGFPAAGGVPCDSRPPPPPVSQYLELRVKHKMGGEWEKLELDSTLRGVVVLNLQSYGGRVHVVVLYGGRCGGYRVCTCSRGRG